MNDFEKCSIDEALARPIIERVNDECKFGIGDLREVGAFGEVAAQQPVGVLVGPALPGAVRVGEEHPQVGGLFDVFEGSDHEQMTPAETNVERTKLTIALILEPSNHCIERLGSECPISVSVTPLEKMRYRLVKFGVPVACAMHGRHVIHSHGDIRHRIVIEESNISEQRCTAVLSSTGRQGSTIATPSARTKARCVAG